jgi:hypothetical protein
MVNHTPISGNCGISVSRILAITPGGAIKGYMPQADLDTNKEYEQYEQIRFNLKQAWNTTYPSQLKTNNLKRIVTPFRAVNNSGDLLCRVNYSCGGSPQAFQSRPGMFGLRQRLGANKSSCDGTGVPASVCNGKYVYDSSDYITYLKQRAVNRNYNAISNGGDEYNGSQSALRAIRRF